MIPRTLSAITRRHTGTQSAVAEVRMTNSEAFVETLAAHQCTHAFGIVGSLPLHFHSAMAPLGILPIGSAVIESYRRV